MNIKILLLIAVCYGITSLNSLFAMTSTLRRTYRIAGTERVKAEDILPGAIAQAIKESKLENLDIVFCNDKKYILNIKENATDLVRVNYELRRPINFFNFNVATDIILYKESKELLKQPTITKKRDYNYRNIFGGGCLLVTLGVLSKLVLNTMQKSVITQSN